MEIRTFIKSLALAAFFTLGSLGCKSTNQAGSATVDPTPAVGEAPPNVDGFLQTGPGQLAEWMEERFNVKYRAMTPQLIFELH